MIHGAQEKKTTMKGHRVTSDLMRREHLGGRSV